MSQIDTVQHKAADYQMIDLQDQCDEESTAQSSPKLPKKLPPLPTACQQEDTRSIRSSPRDFLPDAGKKRIEGSEHQLATAYEESEDIVHLKKQAIIMERKWIDANELNTTLQVAYNQSQDELNEVKKKYQTLESGNATLYKRMNDQVLEVEGRRKEAEAKTQVALFKIQDVSEELQRCKDELFNLQPPNQVADTSISAEWEALCANITNWIDDQAGGIDDLRSQLRELKAKEEFSDIIDRYWGKDRQLLANHYSKEISILDDLLRFNIHCLLENRVFDGRVYMVGMRCSDAELLRTIELDMAGREPQRGSTNAGFWRSEAIVALSSNPAYGKAMEKAAARITDEATDFLQPLLSRLKSGAMMTFHQEIVMPAIALASNMRKSTAEYKFAFRVASDIVEERRPLLRPPGKSSLLYKADLEDNDILDLSSRISLKKGRNCEEERDGSIADNIMVICPALYRTTRTERILLTKQVVLAQFFKPPQRRGPQRDVDSSRGLLDRLDLKF